MVLVFEEHGVALALASPQKVADSLGSLDIADGAYVAPSSQTEPLTLSTTGDVYGSVESRGIYDLDGLLALMRTCVNCPESFVSDPLALARHLQGY
jgi:hypothetical protein